MPIERPSNLASRQDQMFPKLDAVEVERLRRFGEVSCFPAGEALAEVGKVNRGLMLILTGEVRTTRRDLRGHEELIYLHSPGSFMGELAQVAGRPSLVDALTCGQGLAPPPPGAPSPFTHADASRTEQILTAAGLVQVRLEPFEPTMYFGATADEGYDVLRQLLAWIANQVEASQRGEASGGCVPRWPRTRRPTASGTSPARG